MDRKGDDSVSAGQKGNLTVSYTQKCNKIQQCICVLHCSLMMH